MNLKLKSTQLDIPQYSQEKLNRLISSTNQKKSKLINLSERIYRYLNHRPQPGKPIPVHPDDCFLSLILRKNGVIPNLPIKVLGGKTIKPTKNAIGV